VKHVQRTLLLVLTFFLAASAAHAQAKKPEPFLIPDPARYERATETDADGLLQWIVFEAERCPNCKGQKTMTCRHCERFDDGDCEDCPECHNTRKAACRICGGSGETHDILEKAPCPTCSGAAVTRCFVCNGKGSFLVEGGGDRRQKCGCCDGVGGFPCGTCKGERFVAPPKLKPSVGDASAKDLLKAMETLEKVIEGVSGFESGGNARNDIKAVAKILGPASRYFPPLKDANKHFESSTKDQTKGAVWKHYEESVATSAGSFKWSLEYYLTHQKRVIELSLKRAEHNEGMKKD
jgi:hypothetical protein